MHVLYMCPLQPVLSTVICIDIYTCSVVDIDVAAVDIMLIYI